MSKRRKILSVHLERTELSAGLELGLSDVQAIVRHDHSEQAYHKKLSDGLRSLIRDTTRAVVVRHRQLVSSSDLASIRVVDGVHERKTGFKIGNYWIEPGANEIDGVRIDAKSMDVLVALVDAAPGVQGHRGEIRSAVARSAHVPTRRWNRFDDP